jgi:hypothetical protein
MRIFDWWYWVFLHIHAGHSYVFFWEMSIHSFGHFSLNYLACFYFVGLFFLFCYWIIWIDVTYNFMIYNRVEKRIYLWIFRNILLAKYVKQFLVWLFLDIMKTCPPITLVMPPSHGTLQPSILFCMIFC